MGGCDDAGTEGTQISWSCSSTGSLRQLVPDDHVLARVDRVLDLSWLRAEVAELYCDDERPAGDRSGGRGPADARRASCSASCMTGG